MSKTILVVDDEDDILEVVEIVLVRAGYRVIKHNTGLGVEEIVDTVNPDLILLDINLPGKKGTQVCKELKERHNIPILYFSAHADRIQSYSICQADGFISKPFDLTAFLKEINNNISYKN